MKSRHSQQHLRPLLLTGLALLAAACSDTGEPASQSTTTPPPATGTPPPSTGSEITPDDASEFLNQATFGATNDEIALVQDGGYEEWLLAEFDKPQGSFLEPVLLVEASGTDAGSDELTETFWTQSILGEDQLRQRVGFALSQIIVASFADGELEDRPVAMANFMDIVTAGAFGDFRQTLENVTYSPAMAIWLTYLQNQRADEEGIVVPDENYAREVMQLFTIGTLDLAPNGDLILDGNGDPIETYSNDDVTELAKVFTGLSWAEESRFFSRPSTNRSEFLPLVMFDEEHSPEEKTFLGTTIPEGTLGDTSISIALDTLFAHPNTPPFISRQLIQRLVTSNPSSSYVGRVADAFRTGSFATPEGRTIGAGTRGDMRAVVAAILLDPEARDDAFGAGIQYGKLREPVIRFTQWARAFGVNNTSVDNLNIVQDTRGPDSLNQQAYRSPSVFNFYRPGYVQPGSESAAAGLVAPELQITTSASVTGYANFITEFIFDDDERTQFAPDYSTELALASDPAALVDHLNTLLASGQLSDGVRTQIIDAITAITEDTNDFTRDELRVRTAILFVMTSVDYIVSR